MLPPPSVLHPRTWVSQKPAGGGFWEAWSPSAQGTGQVQWGGSRSSRHTREAVRIHGEQEHCRQHDLLTHVLLLVQGSSEDLRFFLSPTRLGSKLVSFFYKCWAHSLFLQISVFASLLTSQNGQIQQRVLPIPQPELLTLLFSLNYSGSFHPPDACHTPS